MNVYRFALLLIILSFILGSCEKGPGTIRVSPLSLTVQNEGGKFTIQSDPFDMASIRISDTDNFYLTDRFIPDNSPSCDYRITGEWITVFFEPTDGHFPTSLQIIIDRNDTGQSRYAQVCVYNVVTGTGTISITQND